MAILSVGLGLSMSAAAQADTVNCRIVGVHDGDTLTCLTSGKKQLKVRLNQIDAPEKAQAFGQVSGNFLSNLVYGRDVTLKTGKTDRYGRTTAEVFYNGANINKEMVRNGYAWAYREYMTDKEYLALEQQARAKRVGLWADPNPVQRFF